METNLYSHIIIIFSAFSLEKLCVKCLYFVIHQPFLWRPKRGNHESLLICMFIRCLRLNMQRDWAVPPVATVTTGHMHAGIRRQIQFQNWREWVFSLMAFNVDPVNDGAHAYAHPCIIRINRCVAHVCHFDIWRKRDIWPSGSALKRFHLFDRSHHCILRIWTR